MLSFWSLILLFLLSLSYPWTTKSQLEQWYKIFGESLGKFVRKEISSDEYFKATNWSSNVFDNCENVNMKGIDELQPFLMGFAELKDVLPHFDILYFHSNRALVNFVYYSTFPDEKQFIISEWNDKGEVISWSYYTHKGNFDVAMDYLQKNYLQKN